MTVRAVLIVRFFPIFLSLLMGCGNWNCGQQDANDLSTTGATLSPVEQSSGETEAPTPPVVGVDLRPRNNSDVVSEELQEAARELNRTALRAHQMERFEESRTGFEQAIQRDPNLGNARFNAGCAASRLGDIDGAKAHIEAYLAMDPGSAGRVLHDDDLAQLRGSADFSAWLETKVRSHVGAIRSIVFERRENGGDLFVVDEDGLGERVLVADPDQREYRAEVSGDGRFVTYLASPFSDALPRELGQGHAQRDFTDLAQQGRLFSHQWDHELRVVPFAGGPGRVLGTRVHSYRLIDGGQSALFLSEIDGEYHVNRALLNGGDPEVLANVEIADTWCYALKRDGSVLVAQGLQHQWASALTVRLVEYRAGESTVLMERVNLENDTPRVQDFQICSLSEDETNLHLGLMYIDLSGEPELRFIDELELGSSAYNFRRVGSRGFVEGRALFLTVIGASHEDDEEYEGSPFRLWQTSPLTWENNNGMGPPWWYESRVVRINRDGSDRHFLSPERGSYEYGPAVRPDGQVVALTRMRPRGTPWIMISDRDGNARRRIAPGQYPAWNPAPSRD